MIVNDHDPWIGKALHQGRNYLFQLSVTLSNLERRFAAQDGFSPHSKELRDKVALLTELFEDIEFYAATAAPNWGLEYIDDVLEHARWSVLSEELFPGVALDIDPRHDPGPARLDPVFFGRALQDVLKVAMSRSSEGQRVSVRARRLPTESDAEIEIEVRDAGPSATPAELSKLFEPFRRQSRGIPSLALARRILEAHGGRLLAEAPISGGMLYSMRFPARGGVESC